MIRPAAAADLVAVGELHHRSRRSAYAHLVPVELLDTVPAAATAQWWVERWAYEQETHRLFTAWAGDRLAGFTYVGPGEEPGTSELYAIHVDPELVGSGVGRRLMETAEAALVELGAPRAVLWVLSGNARARRFYQRAGWAPDGGKRQAPMGPVMTDQLRYAKDWLGGST